MALSILLNPDETVPGASQVKSRLTEVRSGFTSKRKFTDLVSPEVPHMLQAARSILGSEDLAWDAVQDVLLRIWNRGWLPAEPGGVLRQLTVYSSLQHLRSIRRRRRHETQAQVAETHGEDDPQLYLERKELFRAIKQVVAGLSEEHRRVFELYELHGVDYGSIARDLRVPVGTVRSRLSRARAVLRRRTQTLIGSHTLPAA